MAKKYDIFKNTDLDSWLLAIAREKGKTVDELLVGGLMSEKILTLSIETIEQERRKFFEKHGIKKVKVLIGGNGTLVVNGEALKNEQDTAVIMLQGIGLFQSEKR